jgi:hypothetical protein
MHEDFMDVQAELHELRKQPENLKRWQFACKQCRISIHDLAIYEEPKVYGPRQVHAHVKFTVEDSMELLGERIEKVTFPDAILEGNDLAKQIFIHRMVVGMVVADYFPCEKCQGIGFFRGPKKGYTRYGMMNYMIGDKSMPCFRCNTTKIDPSWCMRLEAGEDIFATWKNMHSQGLVKKPGEI